MPLELVGGGCTHGTPRRELLQIKRKGSSLPPRRGSFVTCYGCHNRRPSQLAQPAPGRASDFSTSLRDDRARPTAASLGASAFPFSSTRNYPQCQLRQAGFRQVSFVLEMNPGHGAPHPLKSQEPANLSAKGNVCFLCMSDLDLGASVARKKGLDKEIKIKFAKCLPTGNELIAYLASLGGSERKRKRGTSAL